MSEKSGMRSTLPTKLPPRYKRGFAWKLNGSCALARELSGTIAELLECNGGIDTLTLPALMSAERVAYLERRIRDHETAVLGGGKGVYANEGEYLYAVSVLDKVQSRFPFTRKAKPARSLQEYMRQPATIDQPPGGARAG